LKRKAAKKGQYRVPCMKSLLIASVFYGFIGSAKEVGNESLSFVGHGLDCVAFLLLQDDKLLNIALDQIVAVAFVNTFADSCYRLCIG